mgnify:CR=1 FL=1
MPNTRNQKIYQDLVERINNSPSLFLFNFKGISANEITLLRADIRKKNGSVAIVKNTLLNIALSNSNFKIKADRKLLTESTAILFADSDPVEVLKVLVKYGQTSEKAEIKLGFFNGNALSAARVTEISKLPAKIVLQAQAVSLLANPIQRLVNVTNGNIQKLAIVLDQIKQSKQN